MNRELSGSTICMVSLDGGVGRTGPNATATCQNQHGDITYSLRSYGMGTMKPFVVQMATVVVRTHHPSPLVVLI